MTTLTQNRKQVPQIIDFAAAARRLRGPTPPPRVPTISALLPRWLRDLHSDGHRDRGVETYEQVLLRFVTWAGDPSVKQISDVLIKEYKRVRMEQVSAGTTRHALTVLRSFCAWCVTEGYLTENIALVVPHPRVVPSNPDPLSEEQIDQLFAALDAPQRTHKSTWQRNRRGVCLMLYAGLRLNEVAGLERRDIDFDRRTVTIRREIAKGGKPRVIAGCDELLTELEPIRAYPLNWAVVDQGDKPNRQGEKLGAKSLAHLFERWLPKRGLTIHAHQLRKTFATELYLAGEDIATIQRLLGHEDPKTTIRYIGVSSDKEREAVERLQLRRRAADKQEAKTKKADL